MMKITSKDSFSEALPSFSDSNTFELNGVNYERSLLREELKKIPWHIK